MGLSREKEEKIPIRADELEGKYPFLHNGAAPLGISGFNLNPPWQPCTHPAPDQIPFPDHIRNHDLVLHLPLTEFPPLFPAFLKVVSLITFPAPRC